MYIHDFAAERGRRALDIDEVAHFFEFGGCLRGEGLLLRCSGGDGGVQTGEGVVDECANFLWGGVVADYF